MASYILQFSILLTLVVSVPILVSYGICLWQVRKYSQPYLSRVYAALHPEIRITYLVGMAFISFLIIIAIDIIAQGLIASFYRNIIFACHWLSIVIAFTRCVPKPTKSVAIHRKPIPLWRLPEAVVAATIITGAAILLSSFYSHVVNTSTGIPFQLALFPPIIASFLLLNLTTAWFVIWLSPEPADSLLHSRIFRVKYIVSISVLMVLIFLVLRWYLEWQAITFSLIYLYLPVAIATFASLYKFPSYLLYTPRSRTRSVMRSPVITGISTFLIVGACVFLSWSLHGPTNIIMAYALENAGFAPEFLVDSQIQPDKSLVEAGIKVSISPYITGHKMLVGETISVGMSVSNFTQNRISDLVISFPEIAEFALPDTDTLTWPALLPNETWNIDYFPVRPLVSGEVPIIGQLEYISHKSSKRITDNVKTVFEVGRPVISITRQMFSPSPLVKGDASRVQVQIENTGSAPASNITYEPRLGTFFSDPQTNIQIDTLLPGESQIHDYTSLAIESGESIILESPEVQYFDLAQNIYGLEMVLGRTTFINEICINLDDCKKYDYINIDRPSPNYVPKIDEYIPSNIRFDKRSLNYNLVPGDRVEKSITVKVEGESDIPVTASLRFDAAPNSSALNVQFSYDTVLFHDDINEIPIPINIPLDTPYRTYSGILEFDFPEFNKRLKLQRYTLPVSVSVAPIEIRHVPSNVVLDLGSTVDLSTIVTNRSNKMLEVIVIENFDNTGIDLIDSTGDIGDCEGSSGLNYYQCYSLKPDEQITKNILVKLTEVLPKVKRLVGQVNYETDDGVRGSIKSVAELIVSEPVP